MALTQASEQPDLGASGVKWIAEKYSRMFNAKLWPQLYLNRVTTSAYFDELDYGDTVNIPDDPDINFVEFANGEEPPTQKHDPTSTQIEITGHGGFRVQLTAADKKLSHLALGQRYMKNGLLKAQDFLEDKLFAWLPSKAAAANRGATAGVKHGAYDLGTSVSSGEAINGANVVDYLTRIVTVAREQNETGPIDVLMPYWVWRKYLLSAASNAMVMGDAKSQLRTGKLDPLADMRFWPTNKSTTTATAGNSDSTCSPIYAMSKRAIAFTTKLKKTQIYDTGNFWDFIQGELIWGFGLIKEECIVEGHVYSIAEA